MNKEESSGEVGSQDVPTMDKSTKDSNADIYENRGPKKIIRVVTVMAYLFSVSFVGILLSAYYLFLWEPPNPKFIEIERLRTDPQIQLLIAKPTLENMDLKKKKDFIFENNLNHTYKPLLGRIAHDAYDEFSANSNEIDSTNHHQKRLNAILLKLRHSLVETARAQNRSLLHEAISNESDNSFVKVERVPNPTRKIDHHVDNTISGYDKLRGNISKKEIQTKNDKKLYAGLVDSLNALNTEEIFSTSKSTAITQIEPDQNHRLDNGSVSKSDWNSTPSAEHENENQNYKKKIDVVRYLIHGSNNAHTSNDSTSENNQLAFQDNNYSSVQEFAKIRTNIFDNKTEPMKQNKTGYHQKIDNDKKENDPSDIHLTTLSKTYVDSRINSLLSINASINNSIQNYSGNNEYSSNNQIERIARNRVSIDMSRDFGFTDDPIFHQPPDNIIVKRPYAARNLKGEKIRANLPAFLTALG